MRRDIVAAIGRVESGSQIRSSRLTAALGTSTHSTPAPAHRTFSVCSAEKPAVPKNSTPGQIQRQALECDRRRVTRSRRTPGRWTRPVRRVAVITATDGCSHRVVNVRGVAVAAVDGTGRGYSSRHLCVTPSVEEISYCGSRQKFKALGPQSPSLQGGIRPCTSMTYPAAVNST